jgi:hypothetical protein
MQKLNAILITLLLAALSWLGYNQFGGSHVVGYPHIIAGTDAQFTLLPSVLVDAVSTDTNALLDGGTIRQQIKTDGIEKGLLCYEMKGGTASSSFGLQQWGSFDGTNFYIVGTSTLNLAGATTTLISSYQPTAITIDPGIATTSPKCIAIDTEGYVYTRFLVFGDDLTTDPTDGVKAHIEFLPIDKRVD